MNDAAGGNITIGTITAAGLYQAPSAMPSSSKVNVRAVSAAARSVSGYAVVTLTSSSPNPASNPPPAITSVAPSSIPVSAFSVTIRGSGFVSGSTVSFGGSPL